MSRIRVDGFAETLEGAPELSGATQAGGNREMVDGPAGIRRDRDPVVRQRILVSPLVEEHFSQIEPCFK